jgi:RimJ/RimL family protein N-acetyltransferase
LSIGHNHQTNQQQQRPMKILETERLIIRHLTLDDAPFMLDLLNQPSWLRFIGDRGVRTVADAQNYIQNGPMDMVARLGFGFYLVQLHASDCAIGICGLAKRDYLQDVDIGFALLPEYWNQGYAHEAAKAVLNYAHHTLGLQRVVATTRPDNHASAQLLEKLGLHLERTIQHPDGDRELKLFAIEFECELT